MRFSGTSPVPRRLVITIMSPLSYTCNLRWATSLYTSCLFKYSYFDREILHLMSPLCFLIPSYNLRLLAFDGHSKTSLSSPGGAFTLTHPVISAKSWPRCFERADFHSSLSPLYRLFCISLVILLYMYNQHDLSGSANITDLRGFVGCHLVLGLVY
jgi:hypothetical protein